MSINRLKHLTLKLGQARADVERASTEMKTSRGISCVQMKRDGIAETGCKLASISLACIL